MTSFEAWCPRCRVTWPPEARTCVHCGGRVAPSRALVEVASQGGRPPAAAEEIRTQQQETDASARQSPLRLLRIGIAALWLALALAGSLLRHCNQP